MGIIAFLILGLLAGLIAKALLPGEDQECDDAHSGLLFWGAARMRAARCAVRLLFPATGWTQTSMYPATPTAAPMLREN